eukprot:scaffold18772_cov49-Phaeocystis_antarctica.AAC.2
MMSLTCQGLASCAALAISAPIAFAAAHSELNSCGSSSRSSACEAAVSRAERLKGPSYCTVKGVAEITPIFETVSCRACHYAISKLCQGMCHHYGAWHVSPRLHIHRFRPWAPVPLPGVCFLTNAHGSRIAHFERFCSPAGWSCGTRA